ncbi:MAG: SOS response transcriptional repressor [Gammaproteobacteria bacterium]|nr:MAG: SOS response transcriptional repressor [Gammaproteobacteria bacterium]
MGNYERDVRQPKVEDIEKIAKTLDVSVLWLATGEGPIEDEPSHLTRVPVISCVQAGEWSPVHDDYPPGDGFEYLYTDLRLSDGAFALEITGDSMLPEFRPGDRVIIDPSLQPRPGDYVVAKLDDEQEATFKKYRVRSPGVIELVPLNDDYPTLTIDAEHPGRIIGVEVEHRKYRR